MSPEPIEFSIEIDAPAHRVYAAWADPSRWHEWDPDTRTARLDGPLVPGTRGRLTPRKGFSVRMEVLVVQPDECLVVQCPVLGSIMRFEHRLQRLSPDQVRATHRVSFEGWLARWLDRTVGRQVRAGLPLTLARLKSQVEEGGIGLAHIR